MYNNIFYHNLNEKLKDLSSSIWTVSFIQTHIYISPNYEIGQTDILQHSM